jgi:membrane-associated HD superfamily phosphohydrolase
MKNSKRTFQLKKKVLDFFTSIFIRLRAILTFQFWNYPLYGLGLFFVLWVSYSMGGVVLSEGQIAPRDIFVRKTIEIVDVKATEERKNALLAELVPIFRIDESFTQELKKEYTTFFQELEAIRNTVTTPSISFERKEEFFREWKITPGVFEWFIETNPEKYERIKEVFFLNMEKNLGQPIREGDVEQKILESYSAYERMNLEVDEIRVLNLLTSRFLKPNARIDITETEKQRELVIKNIEPVKRYIQKGQILVKKGTIVTHTDLESLRALGLVGEQYESYLLVALGILIVFTLVFEYSFIKKFIAEIIQRNSLLLIRILTAIGVIALNALSLRFSWYLILLAAVPFILYTLMGRNLALCESNLILLQPVGVIQLCDQSYLFANTIV